MAEYYGFLTQVLSAAYGPRGDIGQVRTLWRQPHAIAAFVGAIGWTALVASLPAIIGFGLTVATAISWCLWLERHPLP